MRSATFDNLFSEHILSSWKDFVTLLMNKDHSNFMLWRGQADAKWEIVPSYTRDVESEIKKIPKELTDYDKIVSDLRTEKACCLSSSYHELLFSSPTCIAGEKINSIRYFFKPPMLQICTYNTYIERYNRFLNKRVIGLNEQSIQSVGSNYDITFGVDIDISKWTWGQHYGVATPLVDWTRCALVALFFACCSECEADAIAVYSLDIEKLKKVNQNIPPPQISYADIAHPTKEVTEKIQQFFLTFFKGMPIEIILKQSFSFENCFPVFSFLSDMKKIKLLGNDLGDDSNRRLNAQEAFFSFTPAGISIEDWCRRYYDVHQGEIPVWDFQTPMLTKYIIPMSKNDKNSCMQFLEEADINFKTVYPDFQGISKHLAHLSKQYNNVIRSAIRKQ